MPNKRGGLNGSTLWTQQVDATPSNIVDLGPRAGDGQTQDLHGGHECESLLL
jgi:hypothetical protein